MKRSFSTFFQICLGAVLVSLLAVGCNKTSYKVSATVPGELNGEWVYLFDAITGEPIDSVTVTDGKAVFSGKADSARFVALVGASYLPVEFFLEPGNISIISDSNRVSGTKLNDDFYAFANDKSLRALSEECENIKLEIYDLEDNDEESQRAIVERYEQAVKNLQNEVQSRCLEIYENHKKDLLGAYVLTIAAQQFTYDQLDKILSNADPVVANFPPLVETYKTMKAGQQSQVGQHFIDLIGTDYATGASASLASMIDGKIAVVDFWASWCRPCREEISSTLIPLYEEYKSKGVEIIGVDVSDKPDDHDRAVKELGIKYPQLIDSENLAGELYGLTTIPQIMLIDRNGTIVARDLRGDAIRTEIDKLLAE